MTPLLDSRNGTSAVRFPPDTSHFRIAVIGLGPTVVSLVPTKRKIFCAAMADLGSLAPPLHWSMSACIALSMLALIVALYMHAV